MSETIRLRTRRSVVRIPTKARVVCLLQNVQTVCDPNPDGYQVSFLGVKRPGRDADHPSPSIVDVKNEWSFISSSLYAVVVWAGLPLYLYDTLCAVVPVDADKRVLERTAHSAAALCSCMAS